MSGDGADLKNLYFPAGAWCGDKSKHDALVETPVGDVCFGCTQPLTDFDVGMLVVHLGEVQGHRPWHRACYLATILGDMHPAVREARRADLDFAAGMARLVEAAAALPEADPVAQAFERAVTSEGN